MILSSGFWPLFWALIGGGAALSALAALFVAGYERRPGSQRPALTAAAAPRHAEEAAPHQRAA
jgi:hypothetical protein